MLSEIATESFWPATGFFILFNFFGGIALFEGNFFLYVAIFIVIYLLTVLSNVEDSFNSKIQKEKNSLILEMKRAENEMADKIAEVKNEAEKMTRDSANRIAEAADEVAEANQDKDIYKASLIEKSSGFPTLLETIKRYEEIKDEEIETYLRYKKNPSIKGADVVKEQMQRRREAEFQTKQAKLIVEYYENLAPFLLDYKDEIILPEDEIVLADYSEEERADPSTQYLTKDEYRKLPTVEKNQRALERYWARQKSKWQIGKMYERYVGYLYEEQGYEVEYPGIKKRLEDLGRDLIAKKGNEIIVIQCKNWAFFKKIHENSIFQFFGTVFQYRDENKDKNVRAVFYCTNSLSDLAKRFAKELHIELKEEFKMDRSYPCIKCNISKGTGEKIYHLPFDQQYDNVDIERSTGEFFCKTVKEAEDAGFRRAYRYKFGKA